MQIFNYRFKPKLIPTLATLLVLPILINLGLWQSNKAELKQAKQALFEKRGEQPPISIGKDIVDIESIRFSKVTARGRYEPDFQILLDNQVHKGQAGYHVITPLHISGSSIRVLVDRGWVPVGDDRSILPAIDTPGDEVEVLGYANDPSGKYLELSKVESISGSWQKVWQNLDMKRYTSAVTFSVQPVLILLDAGSGAGGYVRDWPSPDFRIDVNRGYAIQWYLLAIALIVIYIVTNLKRISPQG